MFCPGRRVSRLTAIRGKSPRRSRSRRLSEKQKTDEKKHACVRALARKGEEEMEKTRIYARYRALAVFSNSP